MTHAATVLLVLVFFGKWARFIPLATLAAVLTVVSYHMSEWRSFAHLFKTPKSDVAVLLTTFLLTVLIDLTVAVQVGVVLAAFLFIKRMADVTNVGAVTQEWTDTPDGTMIADTDGVARRQIPAGVEVYEVNGPFFFGAADKIKDVLHFVAKKPKVFVLRMRNVPAMDASGIAFSTTSSGPSPTRASGSSSRAFTRSRWSRWTARASSTSTAGTTSWRTSMRPWPRRGSTSRAGSPRNG